MSPHSISVSDAIKRHRQAVLLDEASFDEFGNAPNPALADKTGEAERGALIQFFEAQSRTHDDVQAKVGYLLDGNVGERTTMLMCLGWEEYGGGETYDAFFKSLRIPEDGR